jgi:hypothetical protein
MPDHPERNQRRIWRRDDTDIARCTMPPDPDHARLQFAAARADAHAGRELYLLELAVRAPDDDSARQLELYAHEAYCDAHAIAEEHELEQ